MSSEAIFTQTLEKEDLEKDLRYLQGELEETHVDLYWKVNEEDFTAALMQASELGPDYFAIGVQEALALLGDAHTKVPEVLEVWEDRIPIRIKEINGKYYIIGTTVSNATLVNQELVSINGYDLSRILPEISRLSSKENSECLISDNERLLRSLRVLKYYGLYNGEVVTIETENGLHTFSEFDGKVTISQPLGWNNKGIEYIGNNNYRFHTRGNTMIFQYNACSNEGFTNKELLRFKDQLLSQVGGFANLVVDLRLNSGGTTGVMSNLFNQLPDNLNIYVANGRDTFSSAMHHMLYLRRERGATLIGDNAGQKPNRFGDREIITLPNSKLEVFCSFKRFELLPGLDIDVIEPDIRIPVTIDDYRNNADPVLMWIDSKL